MDPVNFLTPINHFYESSFETASEKTMKKFAITDIHGCLNTFQNLLDKIAYSFGDELYLLGDFVDRGPDSKGVIDYILDLQRRGYKVFCLRGNHDQMMLDALKGEEQNSLWMINGAKSTLKSFGVKRVEDIPELYFDFIRDLPYTLETGPYILVHAGFDFNKADPYENREAMLWIRNWYTLTNYDWLGDRFILHGHTPLFRNEIENLHGAMDRLRFLGLDNGCVYNSTSDRQRGFGSLCAFNLDDRSLTFLDNIETEENPQGPKSRFSAIKAMFSF